MSEYSQQADGHIDEFEGDVIVPDEVDGFGWHEDTHPADTVDFDKENLGESALVARSMVGFDKDADRDNMLFVDEDFESVDEAADVYQDTEVRAVDLHERLYTIQKRFKFKPLDHVELNDVVSLTMQDLSHGSATFLSYIQRRQVGLNKEAEERNKDLPEEEKAIVDPDKPRKVVESIIGRYISYAQAAKSQLGLLLNLTDMITTNGAKRSAPANTVPVLQDWSLDGSTRGPIKAMLKADDIDAYLDTDGAGASPLKDGYKKLDEAQIKAMGDEYIGSLKVGQLQDIIAQRVNEQRHRFEFWVKALEESKINYAATKTASAALARLVKKPVA